MLKKVVLSVFLFVLCACGQLNTSNTFQDSLSRRTGYFEKTDNFSKTDSFKVAMLLPLSGKASTFGKGLQNAAMMALDDTKNDSLVVRFYDTESSPEGAIKALNEALNEDVKLILGPLMAGEVSAISFDANKRNIPVISFSTSPSVLGNGVYTLGLLSDEQIERIISFAAGLNRQKIAVLAPHSDAGMHIARSAMKTAAQNHMNVTKIGFYDSSTLEFSELIEQMSQDKNFDSVLIAETGSRLKAIAGTFGYYDINAPEVLFLGTSVWDNTNLTKETTLYGGIYPILSRNYSEYFNKKFKDFFGETPNPLYVYAYDAIALSSALSKIPNTNLYQAIEDPEGFSGMNGSFRLFSNGTNEHNLNIVEVTSEGLKTIDTASSQFKPKINFEPVLSDQKPEIFGLPVEAFYSSFSSSDNNRTPYFGIF